VKEDAQRLRRSADAQHTSARTNVSSIQLGTPITVIIDVPGGECRRKQKRFTWRGRWRKTDFEVRYIGDPIKDPRSGTVSWFVGLVCISQLSFDVQLRSEPQKPSAPPSFSTAPVYESVFVSYSTKDSAIVDWLETTYTALGMTYLRDVRALRSGETWDKRLLELIEGADLFQLCWSMNAKESPYVADEWRHALSLSKPNFNPALLLGSADARAAARTTTASLHATEAELVCTNVVSASGEGGMTLCPANFASDMRERLRPPDSLRKSLSRIGCQSRSSRTCHWSVGDAATRQR